MVEKLRLVKDEVVPIWLIQKPSIWYVVEAFKLFIVIVCEVPGVTIFDMPKMSSQL